MRAFSMWAKQKAKPLRPWAAGLVVAGAAYHFGAVPVALALLGTAGVIAAGGFAMMVGVFVIAGIQGSGYASKKSEERAGKSKGPSGRL